MEKQVISFKELVKFLLEETDFKQMKTLSGELGLSDRTLRRLLEGHDPGAKAKRKLEFFAKKQGLSLSFDDNGVTISKDNIIKSVVNSSGLSVAGDSNVVGTEDYKHKYYELLEKYTKLLEKKGQA